MIRTPFSISSGKTEPLIKVSPVATKLNRAKKDPETADYLVRVKWFKTVDLNQALREKGFFGNQNSVARPRAPKWDHTVARLKTIVGIK